MFNFFHSLDFISKGDVIENYIYGDQNWDLQNIHGFYTCVLPSFYICENIKKNNDYIPIKFPLDLNRTSIRKINIKNINNANKYMPNMRISDYIYINKLITKNSDSQCLEISFAQRD